MKFFYSILFLFLFSCSSSKTIVAASPESRALDALLTNKNFIIEADWAYPQVTGALASVANSGILGPGNNANSINLVGNPNFVKMEGDSITGFLPYFGERQLRGGYDRESGIVFKGIPQNYRLKKIEEKQRYVMEFDIRAEKSNELFSFVIDFFPNNTSLLIVNSTERFPIRYQGTVESIKKE